MPLKKSALLLILLSASSVSLLVFSAALAPQEPVVPVIPVQGTPVKCCSQINEPKTFSPWDMISQIMLRSAA
ncbi:MAG: hypothetical protein ABI707_09740 [Ferruginibacter sp.]